MTEVFLSRLFLVTNFNTIISCFKTRIQQGLYTEMAISADCKVLGLMTVIMFMCFGVNSIIPPFDNGVIRRRRRRRRKKKKKPIYLLAAARGITL